MNNPTITICGNIAADPTLRFTSKGDPVVNFTVIVNHRARQEDGTYADAGKTVYDVAAFKQVGAENVANSLGKGDSVLVHGEVYTRTWTDANGDERTSLSIIASEIGASLRWATVSIDKAPKG